MENNYSITNPMPPLWLRYPHIPSGSIGWRMGYGEGYAQDHYDWLKTLNESERSIYDEMFPKPKNWDQTFISNRICFWNFDGKPEYSLNQILKDKKIDFLFFWGNTSNQVDKSCLSQWWKSDFQVSIYKYCCMEQYMMAEKARLFDDKLSEEKIMKETDPKKIKELGRNVKNFDEDLWNRHKYSIVLNGNYFKFIQNKELLDYLLSTKNKILVEASPYDRVWGIGLSAENKDAYHPNLWKGENLLGFALMEVRNELSRVCKNIDKIDWSLFPKDF